jgi:hypothetical protein
MRWSREDNMHTSNNYVRIRTTFSFLLLAVLLLAGCGRDQGAALSVPSEQQAAGDIATIQRDIVIAGYVSGDVTSWTGTIHIEGHVGGDVVNYAGAVLLGDSARVDGSVLALTGNVQPAPGAQIAGQLIDSQIGQGALASMLDFSSQPPVTSADWLSYLLLSTAALVFTLVLAAGSVSLWATPTTRMSYLLKAASWRSLVVGMITTLLIANLLVLVAMLLSVTLAGIPVLLLLLLALQLPYTYGLIIVAHAVSLRLSSKTGSLARYLPVLVTLALLLLLLLLGTIAPLWSIGLFYLLASGGLGAAILAQRATSMRNVSHAQR